MVIDELAPEVVAGSVMKGGQMAQRALERRIETLERQRQELLKRVREKELEQERCRVAMRALAEVGRQQEAP